MGIVWEEWKQSRDRMGKSETEWGRLRQKGRLKQKGREKESRGEGGKKKKESRGERDGKSAGDGDLGECGGRLRESGRQ